MAANPKVLLSTSAGDITLELDADAAPVTVANFVQYVKDGFYAGTLFHRVIDGFMIQGGGFDEDFNQKDTRAPIENEAANGLKNTRGSIAMARTSAPHSATAQFFINVNDNGFLNHSAPTPQGFGYCVFGNVVEGMDAVDTIRKVATGRSQGMADVPVEPVVITSASVIE